MEVCEFALAYIFKSPNDIFCRKPTRTNLEAHGRSCRKHTRELVFVLLSKYTPPGTENL